MYLFEHLLRSVLQYNIIRCNPWVGIRVDITIGDKEETLKCLAIDFGLNNRFEWPGILE